MPPAGYESIVVEGANVAADEAAIGAFDKDAVEEQVRRLLILGVATSLLEARNGCQNILHTSHLFQNNGPN